MTNKQMEAEALTKAITGQSMINYPAIIQGFLDKGIPENEILPRENIFTYKAWKALGRQVKKGEHGIKVITWISTNKKEENKETGETEVKTGKRPWTTTVFHISQTEEIKEKNKGEKS